MDQIVPAVEISLTTNGIVVSSERIAVPRTLPFDIVGKCRECKATECETEWCTTKEGVTIWCTRFKTSPRFVPFDLVYELPGYTFFKIKNKGRVFNVEHGMRENACTQTPAPVYHLPPPPPPPQLPKRKYTEEKPLPSLPSQLPKRKQAEEKQKQTQSSNAQEFFAALSAATTGMDIPHTPNKRAKQADAPEFIEALSAATAGMNSQTPAKQQDRAQMSQTEEQSDKEILEEFLESVSAATTLLDTSQKKKIQKKKKKEMEEDKAIEAITPKH
ncbi:hypothetical protein GPALN_013206 [Globodera pallida]|nr:hypothetical protein GPALN_013206 [Globodera pallida]